MILAHSINDLVTSAYLSATETTLPPRMPTSTLSVRAVTTVRP